MFQKRAVNKERCLSDANVEAFMTDFEKWCMAHKDTPDYKRCGITRTWVNKVQDAPKELAKTSDKAVWRLNLNKEADSI